MSVNQTNLNNLPTLYMEEQSHLMLYLVILIVIVIIIFLIWHYITKKMEVII